MRHFVALRQRMGSPLVKHTAVYTVTDALGKGISFLLLPVISHYLVPEQLGMATNFTVLATIVSLLAGQAVANSLPYFFYDQSKEANSRFIGNVLLLTLGVCVVLSCVIALCSSFFGRILHLDAVFQLLAVVYVVFTILNSISMQLYRLEEKPISFAVLQMCQVGLMCVLVLVLVVHLKMGGRGKILADFGAVGTMALVHVVLIVRRGYFDLRFDKVQMRRILKFGLPLLPHSLSFWMKSGADKVIVTNVLGLHANGIYSMAMSISSIYTLFNNAFFNAFTPYLMKRLSLVTPANQQTERCAIARLFMAVVAFFALVSVVAVAASWLVVRYMLNEKYMQSFSLLPGIILSLYIYVVYTLGVQLVYWRKRTAFLGAVTFTGALLQIVLSWWLSHLLGLQGVVLSSVLGSMLVGGMMMVYSHRVYPLPWADVLRFKKRKR